MSWLDDFRNMLGLGSSTPDPNQQQLITGVSTGSGYVDPMSPGAPSIPVSSIPSWIQPQQSPGVQAAQDPPEGDGIIKRALGGVRGALNDPLTQMLAAGYFRGISAPHGTSGWGRIGLGGLEGLDAYNQAVAAQSKIPLEHWQMEEARLKALQQERQMQPPSEDVFAGVQQQKDALNEIISKTTTSDSDRAAAAGELARIDSAEALFKGGYITADEYFEKTKSDDIAKMMLEGSKAGMAGMESDILNAILERLKHPGSTAPGSTAPGSTTPPPPPPPSSPAASPTSTATSTPDPTATVTAAPSPGAGPSPAAPTSPAPSPTEARTPPATMPTPAGPSAAATPTGDEARWGFKPIDTAQGGKMAESPDRIWHVMGGGGPTAIGSLVGLPFSPDEIDGLRAITSSTYAIHRRAGGNDWYFPIGPGQWQKRTIAPPTSASPSPAASSTPAAPAASPSGVAPSMG